MGEFLIYFMLALVVIGLIGSGIAWLFIHALPWVILFLVLVFIGLFVWLRVKWLEKQPDVSQLARETADAGQNEREARSVMATLTTDRPAVTRKAQELERLRERYLGEVNFHVLATQHFESMKLADSWYDHKSQASTTHKKLTSGIHTLESHAKRMEQAGGRKREIETARRSTSSLSTVARELSNEIDRSANELKVYNHQTGQLRDHIHAHCGERGRRWYVELQERKRQRDFDN
jgi:hypothetical protein